MAYSNGLITKPVSIYDVERALGSSSTDLATLIKDGVINKWARYKPIRTLTAKMSPATFSDRKGVNFGLEVPYCERSMMNAMVYYLVYDEKGENDKWLYIRPRGDMTGQTGGIKEYFRLTDFCRHPSQEVLGEGDPTPVALQGYNHNAKIPFQVFLTSSGMIERTDSDGKYYEVNLQETTTITFSFYNSDGNDLHLQDFVDLTLTGDVVWRPVLQVFNEYIQLNSQNINDRLPWYQRTNIGTRDMQFAGDAITASTTSSWSVIIDLTDSKFTPWIGATEKFHVCIGVGCVNDDFSSWGSGNNLFILPYTDQQWEDVELPFYFRFQLTSHEARKLEFTALSYYRDGYASWNTAGGTAPYFEIQSNATGALRLTMTLTKLPNQTVDFVGENGSAQTAGASTYKIQLRESVTGQQGERIFYLTPAANNTNWTTAAYVNVPTGATKTTKTLYATVNVGTYIPIGGYGTFHVYSQTGNADWVNNGFFSIHRLA